MIPMTDQTIQEGITRTVISGIIGATPIGALVNAYHEAKTQEEEQKIAKQLGKKVEEIKNSRVIGKAILGIIPIIGTISNILTAHKYGKAVKELKNLEKKIKRGIR